MTVTILLVFGSAFFTDIIGVHAIFGGFLAGLAIPHEGGLAIALTEKLEDMVSIIFLPLYFTLSGLSTNLGLLDNGITWGYTILICVTAYIGKFFGGAAAAKIAGFNLRESATIGTLMSCKGLVELIVLNVGLSAGILSTRVFSMFVLEALLLTFATTPVAIWLYPQQYRVRATAMGGNFDSANDQDRPRMSSSLGEGAVGLKSKQKFLFVLDKFESLPGAMMLSRLLQVLQPTANDATPPALEDETHSKSEARRSASLSYLPAQEPAPTPKPRGVTVDALRLLELTERTSAVMRSSEIDQMLMRDPLLTVFRTFAELEDVPVSSSLSIVGHENFTAVVTEHSNQNGDEMVVVDVSALSPGVASALSRITFKTNASAAPLRSIVSQAQALGSKRRLMSVVGRGKRLAVESHREEIGEMVEECGAEKGMAGEVRKTAGDVACALLVNAVQGPMVVLQAAYANGGNDSD
ncbi:K(+)/H(+) antiporter [Ceratobasidium sp. 392]|nr:K(+)/H(+) antiporter [Ceratobasidium sp. 392]